MRIQNCANFWATLYSSFESPCRLPIRHNRNFFRCLLPLRRYKRKTVEVGVFRRGGSLDWAQISDGRGLRLIPCLH